MALAAPDDPIVRTARRILLIGVTGSGKSTLARQLEHREGIPAIDVDALAWQPHWTKTPDPELAAAAKAIAGSDVWVMDSAWTAIRPAVLPHTELVVALDLQRRVSLSRLLVRTVRRLATREPICGDNVETWRSVLGRDSIVVWHFRSFAKTRALVDQWEADPDLPPVLRLTRPAQVEAWVELRAGLSS